MNRPIPRDGVLTANGLSADFRFINAHPKRPTMCLIETVSGEHWAEDSELVWDPPRDLSPEAAALIAKEKP